MTEHSVKLIIGGLLHDVGKVIFRRGSDRRNHSISGYDYLKLEADMNDDDILNCVKYHHRSLLKAARIPADHICYIVYMADNIAAMADRREKDDGTYGFEKTMPLESIFNILNNNDQQYYYAPADMNPKNPIPCPVNHKIEFDQSYYGRIKQNITANLRGVSWTEEYVNSLLEVLEANLSFVPSSTSTSERADISLFDHSKLTAAIASCIDQYVKEQQIRDLKKYLFEEGRKFYDTEAFLLFSMDVSGIQKFIYTITTKNALRTLRARSFYLEIMQEHIIDELLNELQLSRANLIYSGGGHCYLLLPNTREVKITVKNYLRELNQWFLQHFGISLYVAGAFAPCSGNTLRNEPEGSYAQLFRQVSGQISRQKLHRYSGGQIRSLNSQENIDYTRECIICKKIGHTDSDGVCTLCRQFERLSQNVLYGEAFSVIKRQSEDFLPLPGGFSLVCDSRESLKSRMAEDKDFVRSYTKNAMFTGRHISTKLWVGDYTTGQTFEEFAADGTGIERIGVLRADVDNLGMTFVSGFDHCKYGDVYNTLSRTAALSRKLSMFFKFHIRQILNQGTFYLPGRSMDRERQATIIYSGGDDVFIVGHWLDIIEFSVDLKNSLKAYTQGTLSISAGIGIYEHSYPVSVIAEETGMMENASKEGRGKTV